MEPTTISSWSATCQDAKASTLLTSGRWFWLSPSLASAQRSTQNQLASPSQCVFPFSGFRSDQKLPQIQQTQQALWTPFPNTHRTFRSKILRMLASDERLAGQGGVGHWLWYSAMSFYSTRYFEQPDFINDLDKPILGDALHHETRLLSETALSDTRLLIYHMIQSISIRFTKYIL